MLLTEPEIAIIKTAIDSVKESISARASNADERETLIMSLQDWCLLLAGIESDLLISTDPREEDGTFNSKT
jgi:hypothetical protein